MENIVNPPITDQNTIPKAQLIGLLNLAEEARLKGIERKRKGLIRDWIMLKVFLLAGLRRQELCDLKVEDCLVGFGKKSLRVRRGKNGKERLVEISNAFKSDITWYLQWKKDHGENSPGAYFLKTERNHQYSPSGIWARWKKYAPNCRLHDARNTYGVLLMSASGSPNIVQKQLGLSKNSTALKYARVTIGKREMFNSVEKFTKNLTKRTDENKDLMETLSSIKADGRSYMGSFNEENKGYVYIIECNGVYKIGCSNNPSHRKTTLQTSSPFPMTIKCVFRVDDGHMEKLEREIHSIFANQKLHGEWYNINNKQLGNLLTKYSDKIAWSNIKSY